MSLVNDMLKDLDQRRKDSGAAVSSTVLPPVSEAKAHSNTKQVLAAVVVLLFCAAGGAAYIWLQQTGPTAATVSNVRTTVISPPAPAVAGQPPDTQLGAMDDLDPQFGDAVQPVRDVPERAVSGAQPTLQSGTSTAIDEPQPQSDRGSPSSSVAPERDVVSAGAALDEFVPPVDGSSDDESASDVNRTDVPNNSAQTASAPVAPAPGGLDLTEDEPNSREATAAVEATPEVRSEGRLTPEELDRVAVQEALTLMAENSSTAAYDRLQQEISENRYAHQSREIYAKLLMQAGDVSGAGQLIDEGMTLTPNHAGFKKVKARLLMASGGIGEAASLLTRRAPTVSEDVEYHEILAAAQLAGEDYEGARISYSSLVQQDRSKGNWWYGYAASSDFLGNRSVAAQAYNRAIQSFDLSPSLRRRSEERLAQLSQ